MAFLALIIIIGLEGMQFGLFWLHRTPGGGQGGSRGPKIVTFLGATFGLQIGKFWIV